MLLGIALHAALSLYPTIWPVTDVTADADGYFDEFVLAVHGFRISRRHSRSPMPGS